VWQHAYTNQRTFVSNKNNRQEHGKNNRQCSGKHQISNKYKIPNKRDRHTSILLSTPSTGSKQSTPQLLAAIMLINSETKEVAGQYQRQPSKACSKFL
jgi:hypothetical protein